MDFHSMKRKELQGLCKKHKIPANLTNSEMANMLASVLKIHEDETAKEKPNRRGRSCMKNFVDVVTESDSDIVNRKNKKVRFSPENETFEFVGMTANPNVDKRMVRTKTRMRDMYDNGGQAVEYEDEPVRVTRARVSIGRRVVTISSPGVVRQRGKKLVKGAGKSDEPPVPGPDMYENTVDERTGVVTRRSVKNKEVVDDVVSRKNSRQKNTQKRNVSSGDEVSENDAVGGVTEKGLRRSKRKIENLDELEGLNGELDVPEIDGKRKSRSNTQLAMNASAVDNESKPEADVKKRNAHANLRISLRNRNTNKAIAKSGVEVRENSSLAGDAGTQPEKVFRRPRRNAEETEDSEGLRGELAKIEPVGTRQKRSTTQLAVKDSVVGCGTKTETEVNDDDAQVISRKSLRQKNRKKTSSQTDVSENKAVIAAGGIAQPVKAPRLSKHIDMNIERSEPLQEESGNTEIKVTRSRTLMAAKTSTVNNGAETKGEALEGEFEEPLHTGRSLKFVFPGSKKLRTDESAAVCMETHKNIRMRYPQNQSSNPFMEKDGFKSEGYVRRSSRNASKDESLAISGVNETGSTVAKSKPEKRRRVAVLEEEIVETEHSPVADSGCFTRSASKRETDKHCGKNTQNRSKLPTLEVVAPLFKGNSTNVIGEEAAEAEGTLRRSSRNASRDESIAVLDGANRIVSIVETKHTLVHDETPRRFTCSFTTNETYKLAYVDGEISGKNPQSRPSPFFMEKEASESKGSVRRDVSRDELQPILDGAIGTGRSFGKGKSAKKMGETLLEEEIVESEHATVNEEPPRRFTRSVSESETDRSTYVIGQSSGKNYSQSRTKLPISKPEAALSDGSSPVVTKKESSETKGSVRRSSRNASKNESFGIRDGAHETGSDAGKSKLAKQIREAVMEEEIIETEYAPVDGPPIRRFTVSATKGETDISENVKGQFSGKKIPQSRSKSPNLKSKTPLPEGSSTIFMEKEASETEGIMRRSRRNASSDESNGANESGSPIGNSKPKKHRQEAVLIEKIVETEYGPLDEEPTRRFTRSANKSEIDRLANVKGQLSGKNPKSRSKIPIMKLVAPMPESTSSICMVRKASDTTESIRRSNRNVSRYKSHAVSDGANGSTRAVVGKSKPRKQRQEMYLEEDIVETEHTAVDGEPPIKLTSTSNRTETGSGKLSGKNSPKSRSKSSIPKVTLNIFTKVEASEGEASARRSSRDELRAISDGANGTDNAVENKSRKQQKDSVIEEENTEIEHDPIVEKSTRRSTRSVTKNESDRSVYLTDKKCRNKPLSSSNSPILEVEAPLLEGTSTVEGPDCVNVQYCLPKVAGSTIGSVSSSSEICKDNTYCITQEDKSTEDNHKTPNLDTTKCLEMMNAVEGSASKSLKSFEDVEIASESVVATDKGNISMGVEKPVENYVPKCNENDLVDPKPMKQINVAGDAGFVEATVVADSFSLVDQTDSAGNLREIVMDEEPKTSICIQPCVVLVDHGVMVEGATVQEEQETADTEEKDGGNASKEAGRTTFAGPIDGNGATSIIEEKDDVCDIESVMECSEAHHSSSRSMHSMEMEVLVTNSIPSVEEPIPGAGLMEPDICEMALNLVSCNMNEAVEDSHQKKSVSTQKSSVEKYHCSTTDRTEFSNWKEVIDSVTKGHNYSANELERDEVLPLVCSDVVADGAAEDGKSCFHKEQNSVEFSVNYEGSSSKDNENALQRNAKMVSNEVEFDCKDSVWTINKLESSPISQNVDNSCGGNHTELDYSSGGKLTENDLSSSGVKSKGIVTSVFSAESPYKECNHQPILQTSLLEASTTELAADKEETSGYGAQKSDQIKFRVGCVFDEEVELSSQERGEEPIAVEDDIKNDIDGNSGMDNGPHIVTNKLAERSSDLTSSTHKNSSGEISRPAISQEKDIDRAATRSTPFIAPEFAVTASSEILCCQQTPLNTGDEIVQDIAVSVNEATGKVSKEVIGVMETRDDCLLELNMLSNTEKETDCGSKESDQDKIMPVDEAGRKVGDNGKVQKVIKAMEREDDCFLIENLSANEENGITYQGSIESDQENQLDLLFATPDSTPPRDNEKRTPSCAAKTDQGSMERDQENELGILFATPDSTSTSESEHQTSSCIAKNSAQALSLVDTVEKMNHGGFGQVKSPELVEANVGDEENASALEYKGEEITGEGCNVIKGVEHVNDGTAVALPPTICKNNLVFKKQMTPKFIERTTECVEGTETLKDQNKEFLLHGSVATDKQVFEDDPESSNRNINTPTASAGNFIESGGFNEISGKTMEGMVSSAPLDGNSRCKGTEDVHLDGKVEYCLNNVDLALDIDVGPNVSEKLLDSLSSVSEKLLDRRGNFQEISHQYEETVPQFDMNFGDIQGLYEKDFIDQEQDERDSFTIDENTSGGCGNKVLKEASTGVAGDALLHFGEALVHDFVGHKNAGVICDDWDVMDSNFSAELKLDVSYTPQLSSQYCSMENHKVLECSSISEFGVSYFEEHRATDLAIESNMFSLGNNLLLGDNEVDEEKSNAGEGQESLSVSLAEEQLFKSGAGEHQMEKENAGLNNNRLAGSDAPSCENDEILKRSNEAALIEASAKSVSTENADGASDASLAALNAGMRPLCREIVQSENTETKTDFNSPDKESDCTTMEGKNCKTILIQGTPSKAVVTVDMKENAQSFKKEPGILTVDKSVTKRRALEVLQKKMA